jgi:DNA-binding response OmpR family regulator
MCEDLGWTMIGPATRLAEALSLARTEAFDAALLDVNLDGEMSWEVATILKRRGIPFAFSTGYNEVGILPDGLEDSEIFAKPYRIADVERRLRLMVAKRAAPKGV